MAGKSKTDALTMVALHLVPIVMLGIAIAAMPYWYYLLLRVVVCFCCALLVLMDRLKARPVWLQILAGAVAIIFNPFVPLHLTREIWAILNIAGACAVALHGVVMLRGVDAARERL